MGSHMNFKNIGDMSQQAEGSGGSGRPPGNLSLARQTSIYSLTFEEFQNAMGGFGKDFGSMNMDEFLKNVWTAEETQVMGSTFGVPEGGVPVGTGTGTGGNLQRQGSLTLPRTLSQKTVDEVWRDLFKENGGGGGKDVSANGGSSLPQRQQTLGEMTLEEFLVRAGVVREEAQAVAQANNGGFYPELLSNNNNNNNNPGLSLGFGQPAQNNGVMTNLGQTTQNNGVMANLIGAGTNNIAGNQSPNLAIGINGVRTPFLQQPQQQQQQQQQQLQQLQLNQQQQQQNQRQQPLFPKQPAVSYASSVHLTNGQLASPGARGSILGMANPAINSTLVQGGGVMGMVGLGAGAVTVATESPDGLGRSNGDMSSLSPVPYSFNGGLRGRRSSGTVEKVVERRQRRMIKNRESAARSRARKQAYTMELEAELAKLREQNEELQKKQAEIMEMQKIKVLEMMNQQRGPKKQCLRRTQTGPW